MRLRNAHVEFLFNGPENAERTMILAHGAGAGMDHEFMEFIATGLAERGLRVVRFEFPYMARRRATGSRRPPDRLPVLREAWLSAIESIDAERLVIGGKSMGGRIASLIADEAGVDGLICLGYPFHPSGKSEQVRTEHLVSLRTPTLIVQGERDALGNREEVRGYELSKQVKLHWLTDGDHSFKPRKASGRTVDDNLYEAVNVVAAFAKLVGD
jgi:predicted alpha/beta-hydrolase family hydrolase